MELQSPGPFSHTYLVPLPGGLRFKTLKPFTLYITAPARKRDLGQGWRLVGRGHRAEGAKQAVSVCPCSPLQETATWWQTVEEARWT